MNKVFGNYEVAIRDEPTYSRNSTDNPRSYINEYCRNDKYEHVSAHGINVSENEEILGSAVLLGVGGATRVNDNSLAFNGTSLYVAAGDALYSLSLPALKLNWCKKVDFATCFGVFWLDDRSCLLTWGELEIGCYSKDGEKLWSTSGPDIFTEGMEVHGGIAKVTDFNGDVHEINLSNGAISSANT
ncbi:hypothetical protein [Shewanella sedimentimangrovi]|uniref:Uncharacterized protein n=1 Tax=Shewanella sedimentimangrovi TaxID=2814293 RepID=A0ABX7R044_9GAMM|nr:hypothetical protein [Shewanella sedimentimangrovi]QSX36874.1 hypothetical protein JYB85_16645 [Shewanella sedimentimangrovi]